MSDETGIPSLQWGRVAQKGEMDQYVMNGGPIPEGDPYEWLALMPCAISLKRQFVHAQTVNKDREPTDYLVPLEVWLDMSNLVIRVFDVADLLVD